MVRVHHEWCFSVDSLRDFGLVTRLNSGLLLVDTARPHNYAGLYPVFIFIGISSFMLLPVALEIGVEVTSSAESSSAVFWCGANILTAVFVGVSVLQTSISISRLPGHSTFY